jgi:hypothetical protein
MSVLAFSQESLIDRYGIHINDSHPWANGHYLYKSFNEAFGLIGDAAYNSSDVLFNERGVDPYAEWFTAFDPQVIKANGNSAKLTHQLNVLTPDGGIYSLSDGMLDLPSLSNVVFQMFTQIINHPTEYEYAWYSDPDKNSLSIDDDYHGISNGMSLKNTGDGKIHMLAFDVSEFYDQDIYDSVYFFAFEDLSAIANQSRGLAESDYDYNDYYFILTNVRPEAPAVTPEPATLLMFLVGVGAVSARYLRRRKQS